MITIIGSLNYDLVTYTNRVPDGGETYQANGFESHLGGKGLNEALAVARLAPLQKVRMVGNVGSDSFGAELKQSLVTAGVDVTHVATLDGPSGVAVILVESNGENRILITPGANGKLEPTEADYTKYFPDDNGYVILQNEYPATLDSIAWLHTNRPNINIAYNPSPFRKVDAAVWAQIDLLIVNEGEALEVAKAVFTSKQLEEFEVLVEADKIAGFSSLASSLQKLINQRNVSVVVITMGSTGSVFTSKGTQPQFTASHKVSAVVDTTGAGDTFFGGVVSQLAQGQPLGKAIEFATRASAIVIQKKGAAESIPTLAEVDN